MKKGLFFVLFSFIFLSPFKGFGCSCFKRWFLCGDKHPDDGEKKMRPRCRTTSSVEAEPWTLVQKVLWARQELNIFFKKEDPDYLIRLENLLLQNISMHVLNSVVTR